MIYKVLFYAVLVRERAPYVRDHAQKMRRHV